MQTELLDRRHRDTRTELASAMFDAGNCSAGRKHRRLPRPAASTPRLRSAQSRGARGPRPSAVTGSSVRWPARPRPRRIRSCPSPPRPPASNQSALPGRSTGRCAPRSTTPRPSRSSARRGRGAPGTASCARGQHGGDPGRWHRWSRRGAHREPRGTGGVRHRRHDPLLAGPRSPAHGLRRAGRPDPARGRRPRSRRGEPAAGERGRSAAREPGLPGAARRSRAGSASSTSSTRRRERCWRPAASPRTARCSSAPPSSRRNPPPPRRRRGHHRQHRRGRGAHPDTGGDQCTQRVHPRGRGVLHPLSHASSTAPQGTSPWQVSPSACVPPPPRRCSPPRRSGQAGGCAPAAGERVAPSRALPRTGVARVFWALSRARPRSARRSDRRADRSRPRRRPGAA